MRKARALREAKDGMTLRDAERLLRERGVECDYTTLARFEAGETVLREPALRAYAKLLDASLDDIMAPAEPTAEGAA